MKIKFAIATTLCFLAPSVVLADGLTQTQVNAITGLLEAFGVSAQTIATVQADIEPSTAASQIQAPVNWSSYQAVPDNFSKDPSIYVGMNVKIGGSVVNFLAAGSGGGSTNYIEVVVASNNTDINGQKFMLEIDSPGNYLAAADALNAAFSAANPNTTDMGTSGIIAYGTIEASQEFTTSSNASVYLPVIDVGRLDTCSELFCSADPGSTQGTKTIFPDGAPNSMPVSPAVASPEPPPACTLTFSQSSVENGIPVTLFWDTANATSLYIDHNTGFVTPVDAGSVAVNPGYSTIYTGQAVGPGGNTECTAILSVNSY